MLEPILSQAPQLSKAASRSVEAAKVVGFELAGPYHEIKYLVPLALVPSLIARAYHYWIPVPHFALGQTRSLYFDTPKGDVLQSCLDGDTTKLKLRFRANTSVGSSTRYSVELKRRTGSAVDKKRILTTGWHPDWMNDPTRLIAGLDAKWAFDFLKSTPIRAGGLSPKLLLGYTRLRFACPHSALRANLDTGIKAIEVYPSPGTRVLSGRQLKFAVLELKSTEAPALPPEMARMNLLRESMSKFARLSLLHQELFPRY